MKKLILLTPFIFISTLYAVQVGGPGHDNGEVSVGDTTSSSPSKDKNKIQNVIKNQGLIRDESDNFGLLNTCGDTEIIKWDATTSSWGCGVDTGNISKGGTIAGEFLVGTQNALTDGASITVTTTNEAFRDVQVGTLLTANETPVFVTQKTDNNTVIINNPVDWNNGGEGYQFVYKNPPLKVEDEIMTQMIVRTDGKVGIQTNAPEGLLDVKGPNEQFLIDDDGHATPVYKKIDGNEMIVMSYSGEDNGAIQLKSGGVPKIHLEASEKAKNYVSVGRFGIGTTTPTAKTEIIGGQLTDGAEDLINIELSNIVTTANGAFGLVEKGAQIIVNGSSATVLKKIDNNTVQLNRLVLWNTENEQGETVGIPFSYKNPILKVGNPKEEILTLDSEGNLGFGLFNPTEKFQVRGNRGIKTLTEASSDGNDGDCAIGEEKVPLAPSGLALGYILGGEKINKIGEDFVCINNDVTWASEENKEWVDPFSEFVLTSAGNVGIGTTQPSARLELQARGFVIGIGKVLTEGENATVTATISEAFADIQVGADIMANEQIGHVVEKIDNNTIVLNTLINWNNQGQGFDFAYKNPILRINNEVGNPELLMRANGHIGIGTTNPGSRKMKIVGDFEVTGSCSGCGSDRELKKNIEPLEGALGKVLLMQGINFEWNEGSEEFAFYPGNQLGVDAQDLEDIYPELVGTDSRGYRFVHYKKLVVPLIEAIKEQQKQINHLRRRIRKLDNKEDIGEGWVKICHKPRRRKGNKNKRRTIVVPEEALEAHLRRGNKLGPCKGNAVIMASPH